MLQVNLDFAQLYPNVQPDNLISALRLYSQGIVDAVRKSRAAAKDAANLLEAYDDSRNGKLDSWYSFLCC